MQVRTLCCDTGRLLAGHHNPRKLAATLEAEIDTASPLATRRLEGSIQAASPPIATLCSATLLLQCCHYWLLPQRNNIRLQPHCRLLKHTLRGAGAGQGGACIRG